MNSSIQSQAATNVPPTLPDPFNGFNGFMDIPLSVTVELGNTKLKIRDLLALEEGSVIGLSQSVGSDLAVYVNNVCIGQGLIIALEDRTCVRITELLSE